MKHLDCFQKHLIENKNILFAIFKSCKQIYDEILKEIIVKSLENLKIAIELNDERGLFIY